MQGTASLKTDAGRSLTPCASAAPWPKKLVFYVVDYRGRMGLERTHRRLMKDQVRPRMASQGL